VNGADDLQATVQISLSSSLLGCTETIPTHPAHPDGLAVSIPAGTQNGEVLRIAGEGMPQKSGGRGALHVTVIITVTASERLVLQNKAAQLRSLFA
jgi:molecular chaperone DnaJ